MRNIAPKDAAELDAVETREWLDSLDYVLQSGGPVKVARLLRELTPARDRERRQAAVHRQHALHQHDPRRRAGADAGQPRYRAPHQEPRPLECARRWSCGPTRPKRGSAGTSRPMPRRRRSTKSASTTSSAGTTAPTRDVIFFQGHAAPGIYARAYLEGRLDETHLENFRRELKPGGGLSSYPHPWLMPDFWEYPDRVDGPRPDHGDLPGALHALPRGPRAEADVGREGLGVSRRRRDRRARSARRHHAAGAREARQPRSSSSTATCSGSTARSAATARSSRSSKRRSAAPAGTSSR